MASKYQKKNNLKPKLVLAASFFLMIGTMAYVHYAQEAERFRMRAGVIHDMERQKMKAMSEEQKRAWNQQ